MALHEVFGDYGAGKSAFFVYQIKTLYEEHGEEMLQFSRDIIDQVNATRERPLPYPKKPPICANFKTTITNPDGSTFSPYYFDASLIGLNNKASDTHYKYFYPGSAIFIDEAQNYFNSKSDLKREVAAFFEKHRHNYLNIWLAAQRGILINKDIRGICTDFKQIIKLEHERSIFDTITKSRWTVREFSERYEFEKYLETEGAEGKFTEATYENDGNVFDLYDSHSYINDFLPT